MPVAFGTQPSDVAVPGDYNRYKRTDAAISRPSTGQWFVCSQFSVTYRTSGDVPVQGDYNGNPPPT